MLPRRIIIGLDASIKAILREGDAVRVLHSEAIIDVNHHGRWIRGIELVGGIDFNLEKAVKPFAPRWPLSRQSSNVSYDPEADAAFINFNMKEQKGDKALRYSHSLTPDAEFAFDERDGLLSIKFSATEENSNAVDFVSLIDTTVTASD
jgi:uncharacterized protein YuzE